MSISTLRQIVTDAGGTPGGTEHGYTHIGLIRELITALGGTPTKFGLIANLRELITQAGGTPAGYGTRSLMRQLVTALGGTPATYSPDALWEQVEGLGFATEFDPATLFAGAETGAWYDPSDLTTLFQDTLAATPVTADGDPVGRINDKSGNGNHLIQGTAGSRPLYKTAGGLHWLQFDGTDDFLRSNFTVTTTGAWTAVAGAYMNNTTGLQMIVDHWTIAQMLRVDSGTLQAHDAGSTNDPSGTITATTAFVGSSTHTGTTIESFKNGVGNGSTASVTTGTGNAFLTLGDFASGGYRLSGRIYGAIVVGSSLAAPLRGDVEEYMAGKSGVTL